MATRTNQLNVTELDFDRIKQNLIAFLQGQDKFNDYNYEGSGLNILLDILAYNTHYNAMEGHLDVNEAFLSSAQLRHNVVGAAMPLGYVPRSASASSIDVDITVNNPVGNPPATTIDLPRGTPLTTTIDGTRYPFAVAESVSASLNNSNQYQFDGVVLQQGEMRTKRFRVDNTVERQHFIIPDVGIDTNTMRVRVRAHEEAQAFDSYSLFSSFAQIDGVSPIYFLEETSTGEYAIYFGDGIIGKKPSTNNIVEVEYFTTKGAAGNGATQFSVAGDIEGNTDIEVNRSTPNTQSSGGADRESIESIRFNAPLTFITQDRAVTADDYKSILIKSYGDIETISTWGGEDASPPDYGKVFLAIKPKSGDKLTPLAKTNIKNILKGKNVVSVTPVFADPVFTFLQLEVFFKFNPNRSESTTAELQSRVKRTIEQYNTDNLREFNGVFRYSQVLQAIDDTDPGILNSTVRTTMFQTITPDPAKMNTFELQFVGQAYVPVASRISIETTPFLINGTEHYIGDEQTSSEGERRLFVYRIVDDKILKIIQDIGTLEPETGLVTIHSFRPDDDTPISIFITPRSFDLAPRRNQLIQISSNQLRIFGEVDTIATAGAAGAINYQTTARQ